MPLSERRVSHLTPDAAAALAFANGDPGADRRVLERIAEATILGQEVPKDLQKIANALLANALLDGKLPTRAAGRPKDMQLALKNAELAYRYFELLDGGTTGPAGKVAAQLHVDARHVERAAQKYRWLIGLFSEDRDRFRAWRACVCDEEYKASILVDLRLREGRPAVDAPPALHELLEKAPVLAASLRQELNERMNRAYIDPPTLVDEDGHG